MQTKIMRVVDKKVEQLFQKAENIVFFVGSGISVASGIPTFRGLTQMEYFKGFYPPYLSSVQGFQRRTAICWEFFKHMHNLVKEAKPNKAHERLAFLQAKAKEKKKKISVITLCYDGLLSKAGVKSIIELHGNINTSSCVKCHKQEQMDTIELKEGEIPTCACGGLFKPDVVLLDEAVKEEIYDNAATTIKNADLYFVIGSSGVQEQSKKMMLYTGPYCMCVEINPTSSHLTIESQFAVQDRAETVLFQLRFK